MSDNPHYNGERHRTWAAKVLRRAGYRCEECRRYGRTDKDGLPVRATVAHHIQHLDEHPELAYDLANGRAENRRVSSAAGARFEAIPPARELLKAGGQ